MVYYSPQGMYEQTPFPGDFRKKTRYGVFDRFYPWLRNFPVPSSLSELSSEKLGIDKTTIFCENFVKIESIFDPIRPLHYRRGSDSAVTLWSPYLNRNKSYFFRG